LRVPMRGLYLPLYLSVGPASTARAVLLFAVGLLLSVLVFPVAFYVSAALGYLLGVVALAVGVWLAIRRAGRTLPC
jgi:type IV secretory pathway TrbD component